MEQQSIDRNVLILLYFSEYFVYDIFIIVKQRTGEVYTLVHYSDGNVEIYSKEEELFIKCRKPIDLKTFNDLIVNSPRLQVSKFTALRDGLIKASGEEIHIGTYKPEIELEISKEEMAAYIRLNILPEEYARNLEAVTSDILQLLRENGVKVGLMTEVIMNPMEVQKRVQIAAGIAPLPGEDAKIKYYEIAAKKPELKTDGGVDHFDIHLIDPVEIGDWLGEKIPLTEGTEGTTIKGEPVPPKPGKDNQLRFDPETVQMFSMADGTSVLRARIPGAVAVADQMIRVDNHLMINGNVDYSTGNIDFDGHVTIKGTVEDCFSVKATKDIMILGPMGVGAVTLIESREGSISIKGGINGKGTAVLKAGKNVFLKYVSETSIDAVGMVQIGVYAYDANINAAKVELLKRGAKVVGGKIVAKHQIIAGVIGNQFERETNVCVVGFDRVQMKTEMENLNTYYLNVLERANKIKRQVDIFQLNMEQLDQKAINTYHLMQKELDKIVGEIGNIKETLINMEEVLRIRGDGEVKIMDQVFPKSSLEIKNHIKRINDVLTGSFYVKDNQMHHSDV